MENKLAENRVIKILDDVLGRHRNHNPYSGQITYCCPTCSYDIKGMDNVDGKYNLEVNYKLNVFSCWVCRETHGTHGTIYKLIKKFGNRNHLKEYLLYKPDTFEVSIKTYNSIVLPNEFISFSDVSEGVKLVPQYNQARKYLESRNITPEIIRKNKIGFCLSGKYANRIIIPSYDIDGNLNYFVSRTFLSRSKQKYLNPEVHKETLIWNEGKINWEEDVYIVEGVFDCIFKENSIPLLGKYITDFLFHKIYNNAKKNIIIVLDPDANHDAIKLYHKMNCGKLMGRVKIVFLEGDKDLSDLSGNISEYKIITLD
jgi:hypothetical protein